MTATYTGHKVAHTLADGTEILYNRIQGYSIEDVASILRPLNKREAAEVAQIEADNAFADECEKDKTASLHQTNLW